MLEKPMEINEAQQKLNNTRRSKRFKKLRKLRKAQQISNRFNKA